jgi:hypothetical protein
MTLRKKVTFAQGRLFRPSVIRQLVIESSFVEEQSASNLSGSNITSTSSFRYDPPGTGIKSTQQIPVDFSQFENHTFFNSAEANVNIAFDNIINYFPFDSNAAELEEFEDSLNGFENYVLEAFPKNMGYLFFSGTQKDEDPDNGFKAGLGTRIQVNDFAGGLFPTLSKNRTGKSIIFPGLDSIAFELQFYAPPIANDNQVILQKLSGSNNGITLALSKSGDGSGGPDLLSGSVQMFVSSGSACLSASMFIEKGKFQHICATFNRRAGLDKLQLYLGSELKVESSSSFILGSINFERTPLYIGSGSTHVTGTLGTETLGMIPQQTLSGAIDELRIFHEPRSSAVQKTNARRSIYPQPSLRAYFKFNEISGSYSSNNIVLDSSGNSLHSIITQYTQSLRATASINANLDGAGVYPPAKPITLEIPKRNPVLFPDQADVVNLNTVLLVSASQYDYNNPNLITKMIPKHYLLDAAMAEGFGMNTSGSVGEIYQAPTNKFPGGGKIGSPQIISMFLFTWAKHFDELKVFIDHFSKLSHISYDQYEVIADQFIPFLADHYGFSLPNQFRDASINQYLLGENLGVNTGLSSGGLQYVQNEIWKRILINMNEIIRSKGTIHSIRSFMLASGINPNRSFRFREFGGVRSRRIDDSELRKKLTEVSALLDMSGTLASPTVVLNAQGIPDSKPFIMSPFLSSSRVEVGYPDPSTADGGGFIHKQTKKYGYHGIYDRRSDGLWTSGSWAFEGTYRFPEIVGTASANHFATQSLMRMHISGTRSPADVHGIIVNLTAFSGSGAATGSLVFYARPGLDANSPVLALELTGAGLFDHDQWYVTCGRRRNDEIGSVASSSYFLATAKQNWGRITEYHYTSSYFQEATGANAATDDTLQFLEVVPLAANSERFNNSGSFFAFGSQSLGSVGPATDFFLNSIAKVPDMRARTTHFSGRMGHMRFWSKALSGSEIKEHVRNFKSLGVQKPLTHFNFETLPTGSFARLRLDVTTDQVVTKSDALGNIMLFDFAQQFVSGARSNYPVGKGPAAPWLPQTSISKNYFHMSGSGFAKNTRVVQPERFDYTIINPKFDEASADNKVRIRGFQQWKNIEELGGEVAPVYEIRPSELPVDDTRFGIEISSVQALNEDIVTIFATLDLINNAIGAPELVFATAYPDLENLRKVYFNRLTDKVNFKTFFEFFQWFDTSFGSIIEGMIPRKTKFMGVDFVIESHMLERAKFNYNYEDVYMGENNRHGLRGVILLQQLIANIQRL